MKRARFGVVMIEFTLAAAGLIAIAFMTVRVGQWLNEAMVERNANFQATRSLAGRGPGVTPFAGPTPIHLIGPRASQTPSQGTPPGGQSTTRPTCGDDLLGQANAKRWEALNLLINGQNFTLPEQSEITSINTVDWNMLMEANYLAWNAIQIDIWRTDIMNRIYPRLHEIQDMDIVQGSGIYDFCNRSNVPTLSADVVGGISVPAHDLCPLQDPVGIHQIDERLQGITHELDPNSVDTVGWEWKVLNDRKWEIVRELYTLVAPNVDDPDGTLAWRRAATYAAYLQAKQACDATNGGIVNGSGTITSCFNPSSPAEGISIDVTPGTEVTASSGGTVSYYQTCSISACGYNEYTVTIDHGPIDDSGGHLYSIYTHLQSIDPAISSGTVTTGEVLGTGGSIELGYARFVSSPVYFGQYVDPLNGSCSVGMSTDVFETPLYPDACSEASNLSAQLDGLNNDWDALYADGQAIQARLDALQPLYNYLMGQLWGLWGPYMESSSGWGLYPYTWSLLEQVDAIVNRWNPLSQELYGSNVWDQDLSDLFQNTIQAWDAANANSDDTVVLEEIPDDLDQIIGRLLQMMQERLDHIDWSALPSGTPYQGEIPQSLRDLFARFHLPQYTADDITDTTTPAGQRQANALIPPLMAYNEEIRQLILDAEELERRALRECTSAEDSP